MTPPRKGKVYVNKSPGCAGYFIVMAKTEENVLVSPLFWRDEIVFFRHPRPYFEENFIRFRGQLSPTIQARFDRELIKRWNYGEDE